MGGVEGVYSDFLLHRLNDRTKNQGGYAETPPVPLPEDHPLPDEWKTPPLWGVADSAPYFHDGDCPTLESAVLKHHGDAENVAVALNASTPQIGPRSSPSSRRLRPGRRPACPNTGRLEAGIVMK